jgi:NAD(P)H-flavin reductase
VPKVEILNAARAVEVAPGQTILDAALDAGIHYPHGCRSGRCGTCKSRLARGEADLLPHTRFVLSEAERAAGPILAVAGGSGLGAILLVVGSAVALALRQPIRIYHGARAERDLYGTERLAALARRHGDLRFESVLSRPEGPTARRAGRVADAVAADLVDLDGWKAYVAGPPGMVEAVATRAEAAGLRQADLHADVFFTPEAPTQRRIA